MHPSSHTRASRRQYLHENIFTYFKLPRNVLPGPGPHGTLMCPMVFYLRTITYPEYFTEAT